VVDEGRRGHPGAWGFDEAAAPQFYCCAWADELMTGLRDRSRAATASRAGLRRKCRTPRCFAPGWIGTSVLPVWQRPGIASPVYDISLCDLMLNLLIGTRRFFSSTFDKEERRMAAMQQTD